MEVIRNVFGIKQEENSKRIEYLDFLRGILILLVLYHHASAPFSVFVLQFHMPALFVLSGYTEYLLKSRKPFFAYLKAKFVRLMVPYFCFEILNLLLFVLIQLVQGKVELSMADAFVSIVTCINNSYMGLYGRLWFLPVIFFCSIMAFWIKKCCENKRFLQSAFCFLMFLLSYLSAEVIPFRLLFAIDTAFLGTAFFLLGDLCGAWIRKLFENKANWFDLLYSVVFALVFAASNKVANPVCHMFSNEYTDFPVMVFNAVAMTALSFVAVKYLFLFCGRITLVKDIVFWYSINSLTVFPVHLTVKILALLVLERVGVNHWIVLFGIMFLLTIPVVNIINAYFPFLLGNFRSKRKKA